MKKFLRTLSCFLVVACLVSSFCIPTFAAELEPSNSSMEQVSPRIAPERPATKYYHYEFSDQSGTVILITDMSVTGMWSQVEHSAYMTDATCSLSGPLVDYCYYEIAINGNKTNIYVYMADIICYVFTFTISTNGNIRGELGILGSDTTIPIDY